MDPLAASERWTATPAGRCGSSLLSISSEVVFFGVGEVHIDSVAGLRPSAECELNVPVDTIKTKSSHSCYRRFAS